MSEEDDSDGYHNGVPDDEDVPPAPVTQNKHQLTAEANNKAANNPNYLPANLKPGRDDGKSNLLLRRSAMETHIKPEYVVARRLGTPTSPYYSSRRPFFYPSASSSSPMMMSFAPVENDAMNFGGVGENGPGPFMVNKPWMLFGSLRRNKQQQGIQETEPSFGVGDDDSRLMRQYLGSGGGPFGFAGHQWRKK